MTGKKKEKRPLLAVCSLCRNKHLNIHLEAGLILSCPSPARKVSYNGGKEGPWTWDLGQLNRQIIDLISLRMLHEVLHAKPDTPQGIAGELAAYGSCIGLRQAPPGGGKLVRKQLRLPRGGVTSHWEDLGKFTGGSLQRRGAISSVTWTTDLSVAGWESRSCSEGPRGRIPPEGRRVRGSELLASGEGRRNSPGQKRPGQRKRESPRGGDTVFGTRSASKR